MKKNLLLAVLLIIGGLSYAVDSVDASKVKTRPAPEWLTEGVIYQIWLRAFTPEGTLQAATKRLSDVADLGATIIYLPPVYLQDDDMRREFWSSRQRTCGANNPRNPYRVKDYDRIDPEYGTEDDLNEFIAEAHRLGLRVLMDAVFFHCGPTCVLGERGLLKKDEKGDLIIGKWGFPTPDFDNPKLREYFIGNMVHWVKDCGADGFRGDVSDLVPIDFWEAARKRLEMVKSDVAMLGEGFDARPENQVAAFDIDYALDWHAALCDVMAGNKPASEMQHIWEDYLKGRPEGVRFIRYTDHHDSANGPDRVEKLWGTDGADAALVLIFTLDGVPFIYNGQEIADDDPRSIYQRMPIDWSEAKTPVALKRRNLIEKLCALRKKERALVEGRVLWLENDHPRQVLSYARQSDGQMLLTIINLGSDELSVEVDLPLKSAKFSPLLDSGAKDVVLGNGTLSVNLKGRGYYCAKAVAKASSVKSWKVVPTSLVTQGKPARQRIHLSVDASKEISDCKLQVFAKDKLLAEVGVGKLKAGGNKIPVLLPEPKKLRETRWVLSDSSGVLVEKVVQWQPPRHWTLYVVKSAHVDIGLHDPQYKQRHLSVANIDKARELADQTNEWPDASRYRYAIEGLWWWGNYPQDRSQEAADELVQKYVKQGVMDIAASHSGNHTQTYGYEELCRSAYGVQKVRDRWGLQMDTMLMVDNNGITWPLVNAYADAGIKYMGFFPNAWNPKTVGHSRVKVNWDSKQPHLFYWQGPGKSSRILMWSAPHYISTGKYFGFQTCSNRPPVIAEVDKVEPKMAKQLAMLEKRYPYDVWLVPNYDDNEIPDLIFPKLAREWNEKWRWPQLRTTGDLSVPFKEVEGRFGDCIPTLSGMMTPGWAQHPAATPTVLAKKYAADRTLPVAETLATLASISDKKYVYPAVRFQRAWDALICNDEHGYGVSSYKGRSVYDTWMQKRDWVDKASATAQEERDRALTALAGCVSSDGSAVFIFNPTLQSRSETVAVGLGEDKAKWHSVLSAEGKSLPCAEVDGKLVFRTPKVPSMGYLVLPLSEKPASSLRKRSSTTPPVIESSYYRLTFAKNGAITKIFDKSLKRDLLDSDAPYACNQFVYTQDAHKTFSSPSDARFMVETTAMAQTVVATMDDPVSGASIEQRVRLLMHEKRIEIDNRLNHVKGLAEGERWYSFGYYSFPFAVENPEFRVGLNGCSADPYRDQTGICTDTYHAARDWSYVGNGEFGIALAQLDSGLVEFGHIHKKKNTFGEIPANAHVYSYAFNNWLYGHAYEPGPSHMNLRFRYAITSHAGVFSESNAAGFAERATTPLLTTVIPQAQKGTLPDAPHSFLSIDSLSIRLLAFKLSEAEGRGVVVRFHESDGAEVDAAKIKIGWGERQRLTRCSIIEQDRKRLRKPVLAFKPFGYETLRIESSDDDAQVCLEVQSADKGELPSKVGSVYTGLIDSPRAWFGDTCDILYLQWGQNREPDMSHYELYRGDNPDFKIGSSSKIADVKPGPYLTTVIYEDKGLKPNTAYYYCVRAVNNSGKAGEPSEVCMAYTREGE